MEIQQVALKKIFLDLENPRHKVYSSQKEVIEYLCENELIYELAKDIVENGSNPLEVMALISNDDGTYFVAEGNRRLCALKLLQDPDLAPAKYREQFKIISENWIAPEYLSVIIFENRELVADWLVRIHGGTLGGIGRKSWNSEQKTRFLGDNKNIMAQRLLDYAEQEGMLSTEERKNKISTVQRYMGNPLLRDALGVDVSNEDALQRIRPKDDFDRILKVFINDLKDGVINTRANAEKIKDYSQKLRKVEGASNEIIAAEHIEDRQGKSSSNKANNNSKNNAAADAEKVSTKPANPRISNYFENEKETEQLLIKLNNYKLTSIYNSLHRLAVSEHCPLLTVGLWTFVETLTALDGRQEKTDFQSFLSPDKFNKLELGGRSKTLRQVLRRLSENGNTTKHDQELAAYNARQLINDFKALHPLFQAICKNIIKQKEEKDGAGQNG